ncbi:MAG: hypothetical protein KF767_16140 [Bdellovibrionaceae bacterium]|nr:hypothetical protein [Pseudobdellovibrionaceae bacterium]
MMRARESKPIQLKPLGVQIMGEGLLPVLLLKESAFEGFGDLSLPVPLSPLEAGLTLGQSQPHLELTGPHKGAAAIFESVGIKIKKATFEDIQGQKQLLRLTFENHPHLKTLLLPAAGALSLCLALKVPIYASKEFILRSQAMANELQGMAEDLKRAQVGLKKNHEFLQ